MLMFSLVKKLICSLLSLFHQFFVQEITSPVKPVIHQIQVVFIYNYQSEFLKNVPEKTTHAQKREQ